ASRRGTMAAMKRATTAIVIALSLASLGGDCKKGPKPKPKLAAPAEARVDATTSFQQAEPPAVALLASEGRVTRLYHATIDDHGEELARFHHLEGDVRATLLPDGRVAVTARHAAL